MSLENHDSKEQKRTPSFKSILRKKSSKAFSNKVATKTFESIHEHQNSGNYGDTDKGVQREITCKINRSKIKFVDVKEKEDELDLKQEVFKEGWLLKKNTSRTKMNIWSKRWFILTEESLYYMRDGMAGGEEAMNNSKNKKIKKKKVCNLMLSTVRQCHGRKDKNGKPNLKYRFEIVSNDGSIVTLEAIDGKNDYNSWVETLRARIFHLLMDDTSSLDDEDPIEPNQIDDSKEIAKTTQKVLSVDRNSAEHESFSDLSDLNSKEIDKTMETELSVDQSNVDHESFPDFSDLITIYTDKSGSVATGFTSQNGFQANIIQRFLCFTCTKPRSSAFIKS